MANKPNKLGWVTSLSISNSHYSDLVSAEIEVVANGNPTALMTQFHRWLDEGINAPTFQEEYTCLYCMSPNSVENTHCKKCGAPRSFVIG